MELIVNGNSLSGLPTNELIAKSIESLTGEGDSFAILAVAPQQYIQTQGDPRSGFILEYRNGSADEHYSCSNRQLSAERVVWAFQSYLANDGRWQAELDWQPQEFDDAEASRALFIGVVALAAAVVGFIVWKYLLAN